MPLRTAAIVVAMLLSTAGANAENPWKSRALAAIEHARKSPSVDSIRDALDAAWRADNWSQGLKLVEWAREKQIDERPLRSRMVRALWRGGRIEDAEALATKLDPESDDPIALVMRITIEFSRGSSELALPLADRLAKLDRLSADELYHVFATRLVTNRLGGMADLLRKVEKLLDEKNGYPDIYLAESVEGMAAFFDTIGEKPLNQIAKPGQAEIGKLALFGLPSVDVMINGHGPYKMVVDTGGSIMLSLDVVVADEIKLKSLGKASVRGVSGKQETGQALVDSLEIGGVRMERVVCRTFDVRSAIMNAADGIIGTGIFMDGRMTLDFAQGTISVGPSSDKPAAGVDTPMRLIGDAKMMALARLQGEPAIALLDSGADAVAMAPSKLDALFPNQEIARFDPGIGIGVGGDATPEISIGPGVELKLGGKTFSNYGGLGLDVLDSLLSPVLGVQTDILLGMPVFRETRSITVDFPRAKLWMDWLETK